MNTELKQLVERLEGDFLISPKDCKEAATAIRRLSGEVEQLVEQVSIRDNRDRDMQEIMRINNTLRSQLSQAQAFIEAFTTRDARFIVVTKKGDVEDCTEGHKRYEKLYRTVGVRTGEWLGGRGSVLEKMCSAFLNTQAEPQKVEADG